MTENEAVELLRSMQNPKQDYANVVCAPAFCTGFRFVYPEPEDYAIEEAIKALEEVQQYREIGTVEECREAAENQKAKNPSVHKQQYSDAYNCSKCGWTFIHKNETGWFCGQHYKFCPNCGQAIRWNENLEGRKGEMIKMRNREKSLQDHGVFPGDEEKLKKRCHCLSIEERLRLFQCVISAAPGLEMPVYESLTTGVGYRTIAHRGYSIPVKEDDFYAYKRKALAEFYEWLRMTGRWKD